MVHVQLVEDPVEVGFDGLFGDRQCGSDLLVGRALSNVMADFLLPSCQRLSASFLAQFPDRARHEGLTEEPPRRPDLPLRQGSDRLLSQAFVACSGLVTRR